MKIKLKDFFKKNWFWITYFGVSLLFVAVLKFIEVKLGSDYCVGLACLY